MSYSLLSCVFVYLIDLQHFLFFFFIYAAHSSIVIKAENMADKIEMTNKIRNIIQSRGGVPSKGPDGGLGKRSLSDGSLVSCPLQSKKSSCMVCFISFILLPVFEIDHNAF